jgi:hypothetical protein
VVIEVPSHSQILDIAAETSSESEVDTDSSPRGLVKDYEWNPGSSYLRRKLQSDNATEGVAHQ